MNSIRKDNNNNNRDYQSSNLKNKESNKYSHNMKSNSNQESNNSIRKRKDSRSRSPSSHSKSRSKRDHRKKSSHSNSHSRSYSRSSYSKSHSRSRSRSHSRSRSYSHSRSRSRSIKRKDDKSKKIKSKYSRSRSKSPIIPKRSAQRFANIPQNVRNPRIRVKEDGSKRISVNNFALAGLLVETKKTNERLDKEEVERANVQFKKIDRSERQAKLLSGFINSSDSMQNRDEYVMEYQNGEYVKVYKPFICQYNKCGMRFRLSNELVDHLDNHAREENELNRKKADEFIQKVARLDN